MVSFGYGILTLFMKSALFKDKMKSLSLGIPWYNTWKCGLILTEDVPDARWPKTPTSIKIVAELF